MGRNQESSQYKKAWLEMAQRAQMPPVLVKKVLDCWTSEGYLLERENRVFDVGPRYPEAELMFKTAGKLELAGAVSGKSEKKKRQNRFLKPAKTARAIGIGV